MFSELQKCPRNVLVCERSSFMNEKSRHDKHVSQHYFNYKVSVFIPHCGVPPSSLSDAMRRFTRFYLVREVPVFELLGEECLEKTVRTGRFYALSYKTRIDQDDVVALLPTGQLILSVVKDTYEQLGLEGRPSQYAHKRPMRYVVVIDLTDKSMAPGSKRYDRVLWALREKVPLKTDFLMACHSVVGTEAWSLPPCLSRYPWKELQASVDTQTLRDLPCPVLHGDDLRGETACEPHAFLEWLGAVGLGIGCENEATSFLSTYECPEPRTLVDQAVLCTVTGLLLPEDIHSLLEELRRYFDQPKSSSWLSLVVHGFADSPISWGMAEHGFHKGGENFYSFVLFKNQDYWLHMGTGANDGCPP
ncbi:ribonuclease P protein subunit p40 isoform X1 [Scleropages formosus]|nr:ribonuclease P protein subunit p40 isoform X1 [Scleropages formosus]